MELCTQNSNGLFVYFDLLNGFCEFCLEMLFGVNPKWLSKGFCNLLPKKIRHSLSVNHKKQEEAITLSGRHIFNCKKWNVLVRILNFQRCALCALSKQKKTVCIMRQTHVAGKDIHFFGSIRGVICGYFGAVG